ncbi:MAG: hypothetical protein ICV63_18410 [Coleofasciculus sp. Co-bin14]|nr:hypothetical protein [Coleofasciculus sp. Co-bin14]
MLAKLTASDALRAATLTHPQPTRTESETRSLLKQIDADARWGVKLRQCFSPLSVPGSR